jgi:hypothetical protein
MTTRPAASLTSSRVLVGVRYATIVLARGGLSEVSAV